MECVRCDFRFTTEQYQLRHSSEDCLARLISQKYDWKVERDQLRAEVERLRVGHSVGMMEALRLKELQIRDLKRAGDMLKAFVIARRVMEPKHSDPYHECEECVGLYDWNMTAHLKGSE